jgi:predicted TIM-barrel fold metal-dependent hydrolase
MKQSGPELEFFDSNVYLGRPMNRLPGQFGPTPASVEDLLQEMDRSGVARALVWHVAQRDSYALTGNDLLDRAVAGRERLAPCWTLLPPQTGELGDLDAFFARARRAGVRAFRAFPDMQRFLLRRDVMGDVLDRMMAARAPLILRVPGSASWETVYDLLADAPELTVILTNMGVWGTDRYFRPLIENYANVYIETSQYIADGGIEAFVESYGAQRMLFGSNFPECYMGAMMPAIAHAEISDEDKRAVAGGNLSRLLAEVRL